MNAIQHSPIADVPYEVASAVNVLPKLTTTKIIQHTLILNEDDLAKVRPDAVLVHGDKQGFLRRQIEASWTTETVREDTSHLSEIRLPVTGDAPMPEVVHVNGATPKKRGRKSKAEMEARAAQVAASLNGN